MKRLIRITISLAAAILIGLLYAYENPDHKYYKYTLGSSKEINYDSYQLIKKENQEYIGYDYHKPIQLYRSDNLNITRFIITGSLGFIGMVIIMSVLGSIEDRLKR